MHRVMEGVRVLEVAEYTFVPSAGAVLADWGADVIKVEHPTRGDAQRGLLTVGGADNTGQINFLMEHANRGKRSIGIDIQSPDGRALLYELAKSSDVFLTNFLPGARQKLEIDVEHVRAVNPNIIYARGSAYGVRGPEAGKGGYDSTGFWARAGSAMGCKLPSSQRAAAAARARLRRLDRRHDDRGRHRGRAVRARAHGRAVGRGHLAARPRACGRWAAGSRARCSR